MHLKDRADFEAWRRKWKEMANAGQFVSEGSAGPKALHPDHTSFDEFG
jgi:hypothetical protein